MAKRWTRQEIAFVKANYGKMKGREIAEHLGRTNYAVWRKAADVLDLPKYTGKRHWMYVDPGRPYKKDGRMWIKNEKGKLEMYSRYLWRHNKGPIPKGQVVAFRNGDAMDCRIENLELVTRAELLRRNFKKGQKKDAEMIYHRRRMSATGEKWIDLVLKAAV